MGKKKGKGKVVLHKTLPDTYFLKAVPTILQVMPWMANHILERKDIGDIVNTFSIEQQLRLQGTLKASYYLLLRGCSSKKVFKRNKKGG